MVSSNTARYDLMQSNIQLQIQEEKESLVRIAGIDPVTKVRYQPLGQGMYYPA